MLINSYILIAENNTDTNTMYQYLQQLISKFSSGQNKQCLEDI